MSFTKDGENVVKAYETILQDALTSGLNLETVTLTIPVVQGFASLIKDFTGWTPETMVRAATYKELLNLMRIVATAIEACKTAEEEAIKEAFNEKRRNVGQTTEH